MTNRLKYTIIVVLMVGVISPFLSIYMAKTSASRTIRESEQAQAAASAQSHDLVCRLFTAILDAYDETPSDSPVVKNARDAWLELYRVGQCLPARD